MLEEEKLKILEKLKQRRKEKDASYSRFKQKKNETLRKKNLRPDSYDCNTSTNCSGDGDAD
jgi:hypothetical protein